MDNPEKYLKNFLTTFPDSDKVFSTVQENFNKRGYQDEAYHRSPQDCAEDMFLDVEGVGDADIISLLQEHTIVIPLKSGGIVIQNY